jgi:hypothetical protein
MNGSARVDSRPWQPLLIVLTLILVSCSPGGGYRPSNVLEVRSPATITPLPATASDIFSVRASVFHDYNANGQWDKGEPPLPGTVLTAGEAACTTDTRGDCDLGTLTRGFYTINIQAKPVYHFRIHSNGHIYPVKDGANLILSSPQTLLIALVQGVFTTPFIGDVQIDRYYDHDPLARISWWNEEDHQCDPNDPYCTSQPIGTNQHSGTDFALPAGVAVLAAAPGEVIAVNGQEQCNSVVIYHGFYMGHHLLSGYTHLSKIDVTVRSHVGRGQKIGAVGDTCTSGYPHLHFDVFSLPKLQGARTMIMVDPFYSTLPLPNGYWQRTLGELSAPVWVEGALPIHTVGWWTVENQPVNP